MSRDDDGRRDRDDPCDIVCLSHLRWNWVFQRPQHLMTRAARHGRVFFVEEPLFGDTRPRLDITMPAPNVWVVVPTLPSGLDSDACVTEQRRLLDLLLRQEAVDAYVLWYYTPMALPFSRHLEPVAIVYDCMDELSAFAGAPPALIALESELLDRCDVVFTGGHSLYEAKRSRHPNVHAFPSSVDVEHFAKARRPVSDPPDQRVLARPRLGYAGVLDERLDLALIAGLARARPSWQLVLLGPVTKVDPSSLPRAANLHYLGPRPYQVLPTYLARWDVAILPFAHNEATRFISPTKTPEYLAAGRPVVSTSIPDVVRAYGESGLVRIADTVEDFVRAAESLMATDREEWLARVDAMLHTMSWDRTWTNMQAAVMSARQTAGKGRASYV